MQLSTFPVLAILVIGAIAMPSDLEARTIKSRADCSRVHATGATLLEIPTVDARARKKLVIFGHAPAEVPTLWSAGKLELDASGSKTFPDAAQSSMTCHVKRIGQ
ncbi:putative signal peptide-containing protein [Diplocarpon rosae]|nr:putative signal peptide-containing protein [Diplocarpon rosae]